MKGNMPPAQPQRHLPQHHETWSSFFRAATSLVAIVICGGVHRTSIDAVNVTITTAEAEGEQTLRLVDLGKHVVMRHGLTTQYVQ